jgi:hypothetical protein
MYREMTLAKIAAMAQLLDDHGLHDDASVMDELLDAAVSPDLLKEAGMWKNILSRLSGWARKILFQEYRAMYEAAQNTQGLIDTQIRNLQDTNSELKALLAQHRLPDWRKSMGALISTLGKTEAEFLSGYDEQLAQMTARLLKLAPKAKEPTVPPPLLPEEEEKKTVPETGPAGTPEEPIPLTKVKKPGILPTPETPSTAPETPPTEPEPTPVSTPEPAPESAPTPVPSAPLPGWKKEKFGTSGKHGWEWEWEVSPDNSRLRIPKNQLAAASSGKGKILHRQDDKYRPTGGTSSVKLRRLMGGTFWEMEDDPSDPNMAVLVRTDEVVPFPLSMRQEPMGQAQKLRELGKSSKARMGRLVTIAAGELSDEEMSEEEKLDTAAEALLKGFESEETEEE